MWASAEQSAVAPDVAETLIVRPAPALPEGTWAKLKALFAETQVSPEETLSSKGTP